MVGRLVWRGVVATTAVLAAEAAWALLRPVPLLVEFDPSGEFGDPSLPTLRVAVLGDSSVTAPGIGHPDESWVRIVSRRLGEQRHVVLRSLAAGGARASHVLSHQLDAAVAFGPHIAMVSVGGNDAIRSVPLSRFEARIDRIVSTLSESGSLVVLSGVGDLGTIPRLHQPLRSIMTARSAAYHRVHHRVAERYGAVVADQRDDDRALWLRDRSLWSEDLFHVSPRGHARWADTAWRTLEPVVGVLDG